MAEAFQVLPSAALRGQLDRLGAGTVARCYQCATCSSVCDLSEQEQPFPRKQMLTAQWGLQDRIVTDPAIWLCHQCGDCTERCPRDARPADVLQALRASVIERIAFPGSVGRMVGRAKATWPLLLFGPWLFWVALVWLTGNLNTPEGRIVYDHFVPHWLIYAVYFPVAGWVMLSAWVSGRRFWNFLGGGDHGKGSFLPALTGVVTDLALHRSFSSCESAATRRWGHLALFWGFVGAAVTSGLLIVLMYGFGAELPLPFWHPAKILGNISALLLVVGGIILAATRFGGRRKLMGTSAFDMFFLGVVMLVIATGVLVELFRYTLPAAAAYGLYTVHLGVVLTLFLTFPYSKFAHMLYRTLALVHQRMKGGSEDEA